MFANVNERLCATSAEAPDRKRGGTDMRGDRKSWKKSARTGGFAVWESCARHGVGQIETIVTSKILSWKGRGMSYTFIRDGMRGVGLRERTRRAIWKLNRRRVSWPRAPPLARPFSFQLSDCKKPSKEINLSNYVFFIRAFKGKKGPGAPFKETRYDQTVWYSSARAWRRTKFFLLRYYHRSLVYLIIFYMRRMLRQGIINDLSPNREMGAF